ncbi:hypothetical protein [Arthrobacter sp.]|uniref:hypothetical protein n=1 Tax=Arthrobacter sp. TaxID=1667 RepID=UPI0026E08ADA|nr:hypothetical protein [Arthrobacter sp.]MDO5753319.1 hypothetical protein [Arthrobacter sp.]
MTNPSAAAPLDSTPRSEAGPDAPKDTSVQVRTAEGVLLVGVPIRRDTVLVEAGGLSGEITVTINGQDITAIDMHETPRSRDSWHPLTALELPENSLPMVGEHVPEGMAELIPGRSDRPDARVVPFWCLVFPRMRGC